MVNTASMNINSMHVYLRKTNDLTREDLYIFRGNNKILLIILNVSF